MSNEEVSRLNSLDRGYRAEVEEVETKRDRIVQRRNAIVQEAQTEEERILALESLEASLLDERDRKHKEFADATDRVKVVQNQLAELRAKFKIGSRVEYRKAVYQVTSVSPGWNGSVEYFGRKVLKDGVTLHANELHLYLDPRTTRIVA